MGQYYYGVILDKNSREVIAADYACKLVESNRGDLIWMAYALSCKGVGYMQRVVWAGDYSKLKDADGNNLYNRINDHEDSVPGWVPELDAQSPYYRKFRTEAAREKAIEKYRRMRRRFYFNNIGKKDDWSPKDEIRYICNHDRKEYFDINDSRHRENFANPLAVLTSDPTCRILGGGDYSYQDNWKMYAAWYDCVLSAEPEIPEGYERIDPNFDSNQSIWDYEGLREALYGEKSYNAPYPHYSEFSQFLYHGRFEEYVNTLCIMPKEQMVAMYCKWYQDLEIERVFEAYDICAGALKADQKLKSDLPEGVTFIEDEYKLHYLCYNDVKVSIYKDRGKWHLLRSRADYKDMQYDCDNKSRDFHRNRLEAINSGKFMQAA